MEKTSGPGDGGQPYRHYPFEDFRNGLDQNYHAKGGRAVRGGLFGLVQDRAAPLAVFRVGG